MFCAAAHAGTNKAASSSTSLNTRKLDEDTENLTRKLNILNDLLVLVELVEICVHLIIASILSNVICFFYVLLQ